MSSYKIDVHERGRQWPLKLNLFCFVFTSLCSVDYVKQLLRGAKNREKQILDEQRVYNFFNVY